MDAITIRNIKREDKIIINELGEPMMGMGSGGL